MALGLVACSGSEPVAVPDAGSGSSGDSAAAGVAGNAGAAARSSDPLAVSVTVGGCQGGCAPVEASARGGTLPYTFRWSDGVSSAARSLCAADSPMDVVVSSTPPAAPDVPAAAPMTATATVTADCERGHACAPGPAGGGYAPTSSWQWTDGVACRSTPLVANLTDDNGDGVVDLQDIPDVVVIADMPQDGASLVLLDGATGTTHLHLPGATRATTPAIGDLDADGVLEIVAAFDRQSGGRDLVAWHADGSEVWRTQLDVSNSFGVGLNVAIANLDKQGDAEVIVGREVFSGSGVLRWQAPREHVEGYQSPVAVDLDDDPELEVLWGGAAYHHDGTLHFFNPEAGNGSGPGRYAAVADFDGDGEPSIFVATAHTLLVLDRHGETLHSAPAWDQGSGYAGTGFMPAVHDVDGDGLPEIIVTDGHRTRALSRDLTQRWSLPVNDGGNSGLTAFDLLGDGSAEVLHGDEEELRIIDGGSGMVLSMVTRHSETILERPTVADVDNDGAADILVPGEGRNGEPCLQALKGAGSGWAPARRIMNQESYSVTNVMEDGSIPLDQSAHWLSTNSFRAQARLNAAGELCW